MSVFNTLGSILEEGKFRFKEGVRIHFLGVLGAGMMPLSELCHFLGASVFGSDAAYHATDTIKYPHVTFTPLGSYPIPSVVVASLAINADDAELLRAKREGIPIIWRAELLGILMQGFSHRIGVAGTHGKSTTTALLHTVLSSCSKSPTTLAGAILPLGKSLAIGNRDYFVFEACEYRDAFLDTHPTGAVITNIEIDHTDYFKSEEQLYASFHKFASLSREHLVIGSKTELSAGLLRELPWAYSFGSGKENDFVYSITEATEDFTSFTLSLHGNKLDEFRIGMLGEHNVQNATAALALCYLYGVDITKAKSELEKFHGIPRRQQLLGYIEKRAVYYDYAHHPTEIYATISALRQRHSQITVIFRPHTYTRTDSLFDGFVNALSLADCAVVLDVYAARREEYSGKGARELAQALKRGVYLDFKEAVGYCLNNTEGAIVLMGAGEVENVKEEFKQYINKEKE